MPASIGVNLRVTGHCKQGGRKYMEDYFSVAYQQTDDEKDLEYAFFGIFDGHGGSEAAKFAKEHLMEFIVRQRQFWSDHDEDVLKAIREGFISTHMAMLKDQDKWPRTASGLPSTAGTTASIAFIRRGRIFTGHVGDSGIILGYQNPGSPVWEARRLTKDHKPESRTELQRIEQCGGKVVSKSGVPRVVWYRPQIGHKGPITRSTPIDEIPFLAVARSLGDLWSYNSANNEFVVSPEPDTNAIPIDTNTFRCLIFGTDGLWNMISASTAVNIVQAAEQHNGMIVLSDNPRDKIWINPSMNLVERALDRWSSTRMRADNTSVVTLMLDPPGPPRSQVIRNTQKMLSEQQTHQSMPYLEPEQPLCPNSSILDCPLPITPLQDIWENSNSDPIVEPYPATGLKIVQTRYDDQQPEETVASSTAKACYTEENLDKLHEEFYSQMLSDTNSFLEDCKIDNTEEKSSQTCDTLEKPCCSTSTSNVGEDIVVNIQINVVSSSSDLHKNTQSKKNSGRHCKTTNFETDTIKTANINQTGVNVTTSTKIINELETNNKSKDNIPDLYEGKYRERRCRSLGPNENDFCALKTSKQNKSSDICDKSTRILRSQTKETIPYLTRNSKTNEKSDKTFKRSRSLGPCDIKNNDVQKTRFQERENVTKIQCNKNKNFKNLNQNYQEKCNSVKPKQTQVVSTKTTRSCRNNLTLLEKSSIDNNVENFVSNSRSHRSQSLGPRDLLTEKTSQTPLKNKSKSHNISENISLDKINIKRSQSLGTKDEIKNSKNEQFFTPPPRTRSKGLVEILLDNKEERSSILKHGLSNLSNYDMSCVSLSPKELENIPISSTTHEGVQTRSQNPDRSSQRLQTIKNTSRPSKRDRTDSDEENVILIPPKIKRSRSLNRLDIQTNEYNQNLKKIRSRTSKNITIENDEENTNINQSVYKRSRSVGPFEIHTVKCNQNIVRSKGRPTRSTQVERDEENMKIQPIVALNRCDIQPNEISKNIKKSRGRSSKIERNESYDETIIFNSSIFKRSRSLGLLDMKTNKHRSNITRSSGRSRRSAQTKRTAENMNITQISLNSLEFSANEVNQNIKKSKGRSPKVEINENNKMKQSTSLNHLELETNEFKQNIKTTRGRQPKQEKNETKEEYMLNISSFKRSSSLGPCEFKTNEYNPNIKKSKNRPPKRERNESDEENILLNISSFKRSSSLGPRELQTNEYSPNIKKSKNRPPKRERNESDEENTVLSAPKFKRSRSLGPRDLRSRDTFVERNLRERNGFSDTGEGHLSLSNVTIPNTRSQRSCRLTN